MEKYRSALVSNNDTYLYAIDKSTAIAAAGTEYIDVIAPDGYSLRPLAVFIHIPAVTGATSGTQYAYMFNTSVYIYLGVQILKTYTGPLQMYFNDPGYLGASAYPSDKAMFYDTLRNMIIQPGETFRIQYNNSTDAVQSNTRNYKILFEKIPVS